MTVRDTSLAAFSPSQRDSVEHEVVNELTINGPGTRLELAHRLNRGINTLTAAVLSLVKAEIIEEHDRVTQVETGKKAWQLRIKEHA